MAVKTEILQLLFYLFSLIFCKFPFSDQCSPLLAPVPFPTSALRYSLLSPSRLNYMQIATGVSNIIDHSDYQQIWKWISKG